MGRSRKTATVNVAVEPTTTERSVGCEVIIGWPVTVGEVSANANIVTPGARIFTFINSAGSLIRSRISFIAASPFRDCGSEEINQRFRCADTTESSIRPWRGRVYVARSVRKACCCQHHLFCPMRPKTKCTQGTQRLLVDCLALSQFTIKGIRQQQFARVPPINTRQIKAPARRAMFAAGHRSLWNPPFPPPHAPRPFQAMQQQLPGSGGWQWHGKLDVCSRNRKRHAINRFPSLPAPETALRS